MNAFITHSLSALSYVHLHISATYTHIHMYIQGYCGQKNFIAAQTPMRNTEGDVWEMIWMEKCAAVVVLCNFVEERQVSEHTHLTH